MRIAHGDDAFSVEPTTVDGPEELPIRPGDIALFTRGHVGTIVDYHDGVMVTVEGNAQGGEMHMNVYDLNDPEVRDDFDGFGRPAANDLTSATTAEP